MKYKIYANGSFDIQGDTVSLFGAYPGIDGRALCPVGVSAGEDSIVYDLGTGLGRVTLTFSLSGGRLVLNSELNGMKKIGHFSPIFNADLIGADRIFIQGFKFGGPTYLSKITDIEDFIDSHGVFAAGSDGEHFLMVYAKDFSRFVNRIRTLRKAKTIRSNDLLPKLSADFQTEHENGDFEKLPSLTFTDATNLDVGLKAAASEIAEAMHARASRGPKYLWNSWYYLYQNVNEKKIAEYASAFSELKERLPMDYMVIDSGYYTTQGDWLQHNHRFPSGMENAAKIISDAGYLPGIWVGIFMVGDESVLFREHPDWLLHDLDGKLVVLRETYNDGIWGQSDHIHYALDTSHPDAMAYVKTVFSTLHSWGYRFFKTDFITWGLHDSDTVARHTPGKTSIEYLRDMFAVIREAIGEESYWLGCIAPLFPFIGFADGMRIGYDVGPQWTETGYNPINMLRESSGDNYFNGIFWQNDPDVVMLRDFHIALKPHEVKALAIFQAFTGGIVATSDPLHELGEDRRALFEFIRPKGAVRRPDIPFLGEFREDMVLTHKLGGGKSVVLLFNKTERDLFIDYDTEKLGIRGDYLLSLSGERFAPCDSFHAHIPAHDCILLFASPQEAEGVPSNLWSF